MGSVVRQQRGSKALPGYLMASRPDDRREEAASALLMMAGAQYNLPALIAANNIRPRPFRRIEATEALRASIAGPYFDLVRAWQTERPALLAAYANALPDRGDPLKDNATSSVQQQAAESGARISPGLSILLLGFLPAMRRVDRWHEVQWVARVKAATGIDTASLAPGVGNAEIANAVAWNNQLLRQVHGDILGSITSTLSSGLSQRLPTSAVATSLNDVLSKAKRRVARIGVDQTDGLTENLSRKRAITANLTKWVWHHTAQQYPRPEHKLRDGRTYTIRNQPNDLPSTLPFCKCWQEWLWLEP